MWLRLTIYLIISLVGGLIFAFSHDFGSLHFFSIYEKYARSGELLPALLNVAIFSGIIFIALLILAAPKEKNKGDQTAREQGKKK